MVKFTLSSEGINGQIYLTQLGKQWSSLPFQTWVRCSCLHCPATVQRLRYQVWVWDPLVKLPCEATELTVKFIMQSYWSNSQIYHAKLLNYRSNLPCPNIKYNRLAHHVQVRGLMVKFIVLKFGRRSVNLPCPVLWSNHHVLLVPGLVGKTVGHCVVS